MPRVLLTPRAVADLEALKTALGLSPSAAERVQRSLRILERFPLAGRELAGERWQGARFLIGPWPWMVIVYVHDTDDDAVYIVAIHDGRSAAAATGDRSRTSSAARSATPQTRYCGASAASSLA